MLAEQFGDFGVTFFLGVPQRCSTVPIFFIDIRPFGDQQFNNLIIAAMDGAVKRCPAPIVSGVDICTFSDEQLNNVFETRKSRSIERRGPIRCPFIDVGTGLNQSPCLCLIFQLNGQTQSRDVRTFRNKQLNNLIMPFVHGKFSSYPVEISFPNIYVSTVCQK